MKGIVIIMIIKIVYRYYYFNGNSSDKIITLKKKPIHEGFLSFFIPDMLLPGESLASLGFQFRIEKTTVHKIVKETSNTIWEVLQPKYMPVPDQLQWKEMARSFVDKCNVPNRIGSVDCKHCRLKCPPIAGSLFHNYKGYHYCTNGYC